MTRDITLEDTFYIDFTTRAFATGIPGTLGGTPVLSVLEENNATPITAGVSVSVDRASVAGLNMATIVATAANGYENGKGYSLYISTGTVGGVSVVGEIVGEFTIGASAAAVDLANGTDGLGALKTDTAAILVDTGTTLDGRIPAALVGGRIDATMDATGFEDAAVDKIWDEATADHIAVGSFGQRLYVVRANTAQAGAAGTITLDASAPGSNTFYEGLWVLITAGTGAGQARLIDSYNSTTKIADVVPNWAIAPSSDSVFALLPDPTAVSLELWRGTQIGQLSNGLPGVDVVAISGDQSAADNIEADYDGTGYAKAASSIAWNAAWDAEVQSEVADALDAAIPGTPTASSINQALARLARSVGVIQEFTIDNGTFTATSTQAQVDAVDIGSLEATDDHYIGSLIIFTSGALINQRTDITAYDGTNKRFTYTALTEAPADNDTFIVI